MSVLNSERKSVFMEEVEMDEAGGERRRGRVWRARGAGMVLGDVCRVNKVKVRRAAPCGIQWEWMSRK